VRSQRLRDGQGASQRFFSYAGPDDADQPRTDARGTFKLLLAEGARHSVQAAKREFLPASVTVDLSTAAAAKELKPVRIALDAGCVVHGRVVAKRDGKPLPDLLVTASSGDSPFDYYSSRWASMRSPEDAGPRTDAEGRFTLKAVRPGVVTLTAARAGEEQAQPIATRRVEIGREAAGEVVIEVGDLGRVKGRVLGPGGRPRRGRPCRCSRHGICNPTGRHPWTRTESSW